MPESAEEIYARALAAADAEGRLPMPPVEEWETFPFGGEIQARPLQPPVEAEPPRRGEGGRECWRCEHGLEGAIWSDERWLVAPSAALLGPGGQGGLPVIVILFPRAHHDLEDLPAELTAELGPMLLRVEAAVRAVGEIGRVHVCRWGDGSEHLHWWFMARPARLPQLIGSFAAIWDDILPQTPDDVWRENLAAVTAALAADGGTAHV
jgi:diadenosine tetraphosphate (Ap4A) HIT family hydrolase